MAETESGYDYKERARNVICEFFSCAAQNLLVYAKRAILSLSYCGDIDLLWLLKESLKVKI